MESHTPNAFKHPRLQIAICGAGIAGLSLAAFLSTTPDIHISVYEAKPEVRTIGAGLAIWKRYWDVLEQTLDFGQACEARGIRRPHWPSITGPVLRKSDIPNGGAEFFSLNHGPMVIARTAILDIFNKAVHQESCTVYTNKSLQSYAQLPTGAVTLHFTDATTASADILIGADGVHSVVRATMYADQPTLAAPQFSGQFAYRMKVLRSSLRADHPESLALEGFKIWCGAGRHVTSNSVGEWIQITAYDNVPLPAGAEGPLDEAWVRDVPATNVAMSFAGWEPDLRHLLGMVDEASRWAIHVVQPLPSYADGPVALVGDAAHAMTPHMGLGGGQGIEDAYILSSLLGNKEVTRKNVGRVLRLFDEIRRPVAQSVAEASWSNGLIYGFLNRRFAEASLEETGRQLNASTEWLTEDGDCEMEREKAIASLRKLLGDE